MISCTYNIKMCPIHAQMFRFALRIERALEVKALIRLPSLCKHLSRNSEKTTFQQFDTHARNVLWD